MTEPTSSFALNGHSKRSPLAANGNGKHSRSAPLLITGGCGFIGTNLADALLREGRDVLLFDDLSRPGVERNLAYLQREHGSNAQLMQGDIRDMAAVREAVANAAGVFHFAAQVAVTTSVREPVQDFEVNARGTLNVLEAVRERGEKAPPLLFTSTNKVYGGLDDVHLRRTETHYEPTHKPTRDWGVGEARPLDFHSPYGCSKGCADQYVLDYARTMGLRAVVFRMSCIYGPHQQGNEDQGWVAHFVRRALEGAPITLYGDGRQVRDLLWVEDLISAMRVAMANIERLSGRAFNIGGGPGNSASLLEVVELLSTALGTRPQLCFDAWRPGDQRYYVSDTRAFQEATDWTPQMRARDGVARLCEWMKANVEAPAFEVAA